MQGETDKLRRCPRVGLGALLCFGPLVCLGVLTVGCNYTFYAGPQDASAGDAQGIVDGGVDGGGFVCGNGEIEGDEECDDGNREDGDGCSRYCMVETLCGNGVLDEGEECDDGNRDNTDGCPDDGAHGGTCLPATCGDGHVWEGEEQCDGLNLVHETCQRRGYFSGTLVCESCSFDFSGCSDPGWYLFEDFETDTVSDWDTGGDWEVGTTSASDEPSPRSGVKCAGTVIGGTYSETGTWNENSLVSPPVDLSGATDPVLVFWQFINSYHHASGGNVQISTDDGGTWTILDNGIIDPDYNEDWVSPENPGYTGNLSGKGWHEVRADLSAYVGEMVRVRFAFYAQVPAEGPGWYIDDVLITEPALIPAKIVSPVDLGVAALSVPFARTLQAVGGSGSFNWTIEEGVNHEWLSIEWATGRLFGTPSASNGGLVEVTVRAEDGSLAGNYALETFNLEVKQALTLPQEWDFEGGVPEGWLLAGEWQHGTPTEYREPESCWDGTKCLGTVMGGDYSPGLTYEGCTVTLPPVDLSGTTQPMLAFRHFYFTYPGDGGIVQISTDGGGTFQTLSNPQPAYPGTAGGRPAYSFENYLVTPSWERVLVDLGDYVGETVILRFSFYSQDEGWMGEAGWYVDSVSLMEGQDLPWEILGDTSLGLIPSAQLFELSIEARGGTGDGVWSIEEGSNHSWLEMGGSTGVLSGTPSSDQLGPGTVTVRVTQNGNPQNYTEETFQFEVIHALLTEGFDNGTPAGWTLVCDWEWGEPNEYMLQPSACHNGSCVGTVMSDDHTNGNDYSNCYLESPDLDLTAASSPSAAFYHFVDTHCSYAGGTIQAKISAETIWDGLGNSKVEPNYDGSVGGSPAYCGQAEEDVWELVTVDLSSYSGDVVRLRFAFSSAESGPTYSGWYIDDFILFDR